eukprot:TRINITY_DN1695_c0_g1_i5.p1 TRINITY_DN1695_c0_g1~~TRINITY_DN1695_c0_g1_i5.p1  ORF type:complete len:115 (+),score=16.20 TRINITY_DN1695_c0_g1_i5:11-355(+)
MCVRERKIKGVGRVPHSCARGPPCGGRVGCRCTSNVAHPTTPHGPPFHTPRTTPVFLGGTRRPSPSLVLLHLPYSCLLYTSDAADEEDSVDLGGRRIIKKKKKKKKKKEKIEKK